MMIIIMRRMTMTMIKMKNIIAKIIVAMIIMIILFRPKT